MTGILWTDRDRYLLPDTERWGRGYGGACYAERDLEETRGYINGTLTRGGLPGYQNRGHVHKSPNFQMSESNFILPEGFDADGPGRHNVRDALLLEPNNPTSTEVLWQVMPSVREYYAMCGFSVDQHGRAVHPLAMQVMEADIPLCTGYGAGWEGGETIVIDTVVTDGEYALFNTRKDHDETIPSLVGGYAHGTDFATKAEWRTGTRSITPEGIVRAAQRILFEKTGVHFWDAEYEIVWGIRPWSSYHTLNFWTLTYTVRVRLERGASRHMTPDKDAFWWPLGKIDEVVDRLWPDHRRGYQASTW